MTLAEDLELTSAGFAVMEQVLAVIRGAKTGTITVDTAKAAFASIQQQLAANDAEADTALDAKFKAQ